MDAMFDSASFTDEIGTPEDARECAQYLMRNERNFRRSMIEEGKTHEEEEEAVAVVWRNLLTSCARVGYKSPWLQEKAAQFGN